jgi:hypothetical protein
MNLDSFTLKNFLEEMKDPRKKTFLNIYEEYSDLFHFAVGSCHNHQAWRGGYADHITECLRINTVTYDALELIRPLTFTKDQALVCLFLHDIEKPFKYALKGHIEGDKWKCKWSSGLSWEDIKWSIIIELIEKYKFSLSTEEQNAIRYSHGEGNSHNKFSRVAGPLAAHVHHCDNTSARIYYNDGKGLSK